MSIFYPFNLQKLLSLSLLLLFSAYSNAQVNGTVFRDFKSNGTKLNAATFNKLSSPYASIIAHSESRLLIGSSLSAANGTADIMGKMVSADMGAISVAASPLSCVCTGFSGNGFDGALPPNVVMSSTYAGGTASPLDGSGSLAWASPFDPVFSGLYSGGGSILIESSQAQSGSRYLWTEENICSYYKMCGLNSGDVVTITWYAAAASTSGSSQTFEIGSSYDFVNNVPIQAPDSDFDILDYSANGILYDVNYAPGNSSNALFIEWNLPANSGWSATALDSDGIPWTKYSVTLQYTGANGGFFDFAISGYGTDGTNDAVPILVDNLLVTSPEWLDLSSTAPTCSASGTPNNNGQISITASLSGSTKYAISSPNALSYDGADYASATSLSGALPQTIKTDVPNTGGTYIVRVYQGSADCYADQTITIAPVTCAVACPTATNPGTCNNNTLTNSTLEDGAFTPTGTFVGSPYTLISNEGATLTDWWVNKAYWIDAQNTGRGPDGSCRLVWVDPSYGNSVCIYPIPQRSLVANQCYTMSIWAASFDPNNPTAAQTMSFDIVTNSSSEQYIVMDNNGGGTVASFDDGPYGVVSTTINLSGNTAPLDMSGNPFTNAATQTLDWSSLDWQLVTITFHVTQNISADVNYSINNNISNGVAFDNPVFGTCCSQPCTLTITSATPTACDPATNTYDLAVAVTYTNPPTGDMTINIGGTNYTVTPTGSGSDTFTINDLSANGTQNIDVSATFVGDNACTHTLADAYDAPASCMPVAVGSVGNYVWLDADSDGIQDAGEIGINGIVVELWSAGTDNAIGGFSTGADVLISSTTTNTNGGNAGYYNFVVTASGDYYVKFPITSGTNVLTTPNPTAATDGNSDANQEGNSAVFSIDINGTGTSKDNPTIDAGYTPQPSCVLDGLTNSSQSVDTYTVMSGTATVSSTALASDALGGEVDIALTTLGLGGGAAVRTNTAPNTGAISHSNESGVYSRMVVTYDGIDGNGAVLDATGLGGVDMSGGTDGIFYNYKADGDPWFPKTVVAKVRIYTDAANWSEQTRTLYSITNNIEPVYFARTSFTVGGGTGVDWANVGAIQLEFETLSEATDLNIRDLRMPCYVQSCALTITSAIPTACDPATNTYDLAVAVTYSNPPTGDMTINVGGTNYTVTPTGSGSDTFTINDLSANGTAGIDVSATFVGDAACTYTLVDAYNAPASCMSSCSCYQHYKATSTAENTATYSTWQAAIHEVPDYVLDFESYALGVDVSNTPLGPSGFSVTWTNLNGGAITTTDDVASSPSIGNVSPMVAATLNTNEGDDSRLTFEVPVDYVGFYILDLDDVTQTSNVTVVFSDNTTCSFSIDHTLDNCQCQEFLGIVAPPTLQISSVTIYPNTGSRYSLDNISYGYNSTCPVQIESTNVSSCSGTDAILDVTVTWDASTPSSETISVATTGATTQTIDLASATSPTTLQFTLNGNGSTGNTVSATLNGACSCTATANYDLPNCAATCSLTITSAIPTACDSNTNNYSLDVSVSYSNPPTGDMTINVGGTDYTFTPNGSGSETFTVMGLASNGTAGIDVSATFVGDAACTHTLVDAYDAPASCGCDNVTDPGTITGEQSFCGTSYDPSPITNVTLPTGGTGTMEYMWISASYPAPTGSSDWSSIPNTNTDSYDPGVLTQTTCFRRCARRVGCTSWAGESEIVCITLYPAVSVTCDKTDVTTNGGSDGTASVTATGGTSPYTYLWNSGETTASISGKTSGTYTVTVTDANGCTDVCASSINEPGALCNLTGAGLAAVICNDSSTSADATDDYIGFTLNPTGTTLGSGYVVTVSSGSITPNTGNYGAASNFQLQNGSAGSGNTITVTITDATDTNCKVQVDVSDPGSCSTPSCPPTKCIPITVTKN